jgi:thiamine biosynthesis lipoprotein
MTYRTAWRAFLPLVTLSLVTVFLAACGRPPLYKQQSYVFGTLVEITVWGETEERARQVTNQVLADFDRLHHSLHAWEPGTLESLNAAIARGERRIPLDPSLLPLLSDAQRLSAQAEGLFNPAIGNLIRLWGFHAETFEARLPDPATVERLAKAAPAMADLIIEPPANPGSPPLLHSRNPAVRLDLGGYAKGYALDRAAAEFRRQGLFNVLINIGGNVMALGSKDGSPWKVGIQHPRQSGAIATLELRDGEAIGTSGDYQRYFEVAGKRYCHLIDPRTGWPAQGVQAVTVIARGAQAGVLSDVASKPLFIADPADWRRLAERMGIAEALRIDAGGQPHVTAAMASRLHWVDNATPPAVPPEASCMYTWKSYYIVQADYQHWANDVLFDALSRLRPEALARDEGLFFQSIHHTVDHMLLVSQVWLARLQGSHPAANYRAIQQPVWRELQGALRQETRRLQAWLEGQPAAWFDGELHYTGSDGQTRGMWVRDALTHLFTHFVHHRGQISAVATRLGAPCPEMDYVYYRREVEKLLGEARQDVQP